MFDLEKRTTEFAKAVIKLCKELPKDSINYALVPQLIRAAGSVGANYREANDALSKKDFLHRMKITRKEAKESHYWLDLVLTSNLGLESKVNPLIGEAIELKKIFSKIINNST